MNDISSLRSTVCNLEYEKGVTAFNEGSSEKCDMSNLLFHLVRPKKRLFFFLVAGKVMKEAFSNLDSTSCNAESCNEDFTMSNQGILKIDAIETIYLFVCGFG